MKKILYILLVSSLILMVTGCSEKKVLEEVPADTPVVEEPLETPVEEPAEPVVEEITPEEELVSIEEEGVEISEEYADEAVAFATYTMNSLYTKNEEYTNEKRRESIKEISHTMFESEIEAIQSPLDGVTELSITDLEIDAPIILEGFQSRTVPTLAKQEAFRVDYKVDAELEKERVYEEGQIIILVENGVFKFAALYSND